MSNDPLTRCPDGQMTRSRSAGSPDLSQRLPGGHRYVHALSRGEFDSLLVSCVGVTGNADSRIVGHHALDTARHHLGSIGNGDLPAMERIANPHAAPFFNPNPPAPP